MVMAMAVVLVPVVAVAVAARHPPPSPASVFAVINLPRESWQHRDINHGGASR